MKSTMLFMMFIHIFTLQGGNNDLVSLSDKEIEELKAVHLLTGIKDTINARNKGAKIYTCSICYKMYSHKETWEDHEKNFHTGEKPYACDEGCGKFFTFKGSARSHSRSCKFRLGE